MYYMTLVLLFVLQLDKLMRDRSRCILFLPVLAAVGGRKADKFRNRWTETWMMRTARKCVPIISYGGAVMGVRAFGVGEVGHLS